MDSSKRQFLQQLGVLTAGASLVPLAQANFPFRLNAMKAHNSIATPCWLTCDAVLAAGACTVSCAIENQTPQGEFRTLVNQYQKYRLKVSKASPTSCCRDYATIVIIPLRARLPGTGHFPTRRRHRGGRQHTLRWLRLLRAGLPL